MPNKVCPTKVCPTKVAQIVSLATILSETIYPCKRETLRLVMQVRVAVKAALTMEFDKRNRPGGWVHSGGHRLDAVVAHRHR